MKNLKDYIQEDLIPYQALTTSNKISKSIRSHLPHSELKDGTFGIEFEFHINQNWEKLFPDTAEPKEKRTKKSFADVYREFDTYGAEAALANVENIGPSFRRKTFYKKIESILYWGTLRTIFGIYYENISHKNIYTNIEQKFLMYCVSTFKERQRNAVIEMQKVITLVKENLDVIEKFLLEAFKKDYTKIYYDLEEEEKEEENDDDEGAVEKAEKILSKKLKLNWKYEYDTTPALELVSPILREKDIPALKHDMAILSNLSRSGSNNSAHVHIGKPKYKKFDHIALLGLFDEDTFYTNKDIVGAGRISDVRYWAETIKNYFDDVVPSGKYKFSYELSLNNVYEDIIHQSYHKGVSLWKQTTNGKTIEYRYPSANVLDNPNQFLQTIRYFLTVTHAATKINAMVIPIEKNELLLITRDSNKAYFLDLVYLNSIDYDGEDKKFIQWYKTNKYNQILNNYIKSYTGIDLNKNLG